MSAVSHERAVAYRLLGSPDEADHAVREARSAPDARRPGDPAAEAAAAPGSTVPDATMTGSTVPDADATTPGLTAAVARVCLARLRSRAARQEAPWDPWSATESGRTTDRSEEAALETLTPAERVAFVLHDMFAVPVDEIAPVLERTPSATRQLVSRARTRVRGTEEMPEPDLARQREVVAAVLAAARDGELLALRELLDPEVLLRADTEAVRSGAATAHGPAAVAARLAARAGSARMALVDGAAGLVAAPEGGPGAVIAFTVIEGRVTAADILMDPDHLDRLAVEPLPD
ncbi:sigma factor-like helix-turn-helix DNA-binding protein [Streptomyces sp. NPDC013457]|uniref:sigma factor-like helix-turn-helix DNA-binding protein n=1 Tax=Streptomyces sp. NPDC013457 TaxID=3364866 RepID=UPI0036FFF41B